MNQMLVSGNSVRDAEERYTSKGERVVTLTVADNFKSGGTEGEEKTVFWTVNVWGYLTEYAKNVRKGDFVVAQGRVSEPTCRDGEDGRVFVNQHILVNDSNLHSYLKFKQKQREVVMNAEY